jgi:hypothetical protein
MKASSSSKHQQSASVCQTENFASANFTQLVSGLIQAWDLSSGMLVSEAVCKMGVFQNTYVEPLSF